MSPRLKTATDQEILDAALRVILRVGPSGLRLVDVAEEVGWALATLLQRFKTKRGLLLAVAAQGTSAIAAEFAAHREGAASALDALLGLDPKIRRLGRSSRVFVNKLAFLQLGLSDPAFKRHLAARSRTIQIEIRKLLDEAVTAGQLQPCDTSAVAHLVLTVWHGSSLLTALEKRPKEDAGDVATVLAPYRVAPPGGVSPLP